MMEDTDQGFFWFTDHCCPHHFFNLEFCFTLNVKTSLQTYTKMSFNCVHRQEEDASKCTSRLCMLFHFWFFPSPRPQTGVSDSSSSRRSGYAEARAVMVDRTPYTSPSSLDEEDLSLIRSHSFIRQTWHVVILLHPHAHGQMEPDHHLPLLPFHRHQKRKKTIFSSLQAFDGKTMLYSSLRHKYTLLTLFIEAKIHVRVMQDISQQQSMPGATSCSSREKTVALTHQVPKNIFSLFPRQDIRLKIKFGQRFRDRSHWFRWDSIKAFGGDEDLHEANPHSSFATFHEQLRSLCEFT